MSLLACLTLNYSIPIRDLSCHDNTFVVIKGQKMVERLYTKDFLDKHGEQNAGRKTSKGSTKQFFSSKMFGTKISKLESVSVIPKANGFQTFQRKEFG